MGRESPKPATTPIGAVFLSYASQDAEAARRICDALRAAGVEVWFDQSELRGGDAWDRQIRKQIHDCALFIPIISANTQARLEGYFRLEWKLAVERTHLMADAKPFLVPVVVDATNNKDAEVPDAFRAVQWSRLPVGETPVAFVTRVSRVLSPEPTLAPDAVESLAAAPYTSAARQRPAPAPSPARSRPTQHALHVIAALAVIGVGYFALDKFILSRHPSVGMQPSVPADQSGAPAPSAIPEKSIAVLPFVDMSEKHDQEYFGDGMAEEILDLLAKIPQLTVIGRTSSFQFKGRSEDLRTIGERLRVAYVVEGSVRKAGSRVRVTAQLVDTASGAHVWSDSYDRDFGDVLALQDEIATSIARALQLAVSVDSSQSNRQLKNREAYSLYLHGLSFLDRQHADQLFQARDDFEQALALDPSFVRAGEALALAYIAIGWDQDIPPYRAWEQAKKVAERVLRSAVSSSAAHSVLGFVHGYGDFDWKAADVEIGKALSLNARDPTTLYLASQVAHPRGRRQEALQFIKASLATDPYNPWTQAMLGVMLYDYQDFAGAELALRKSIAISPTFDGNHFTLAEIMLVRRRPDAALRELQDEGWQDAKDLSLALANHALGRHAESNAALARLTRDDAERWPYAIAKVYAYRGELDDAFAWLEKAYTARDADFTVEGLGDPLIERLRGDPRYKALLRKMNLQD